MPPARQSDHALSVARKVADGLAGEGTEAVVLVGSNACGDAGPDSDVDLLAVGPKMFSFRLERHGGLLVSVSSRPPEAYRREMADPGSVGTAVPGWQEAMVLHDPEGMARSLIEEAEAWTWEPVERRCDGWVAEEITSLAEEVHKLVEAIRIGHNVTAAVQRSVLAVRLAQILAVHRRILYGSENRLWDLVADAMGEEGVAPNAIRRLWPARGAVRGNPPGGAASVQPRGRRSAFAVRRAPATGGASRARAWRPI